MYFFFRNDFNARPLSALYAFGARDKGGFRYVVTSSSPWLEYNVEDPKKMNRTMHTLLLVMYAHILCAFKLNTYFRVYLNL